MAKTTIKVEELERMYRLKSPRTFYLQLTADAPVKFKSLRNLFYRLDELGFEGHNYIKEQEALARRLGIDRKYVQIVENHFM